MLTKAVEKIEEHDTFINTRVPAVVRIINAALDDDPNSPMSIVANGRIDPRTLRFLKVDNSYQRPLGNRRDIYDALQSGTVVPNIDVGVRGQNFDFEGDDILIHSPTYIIDGWQRVGTALGILENSPNHPLRIFATVHFGSNAIWERHRFTELNKNVKKVSPNLHLRNVRDTNEAVLTLFGLSNNTKDFPLYKRVAWSQNMRTGELITAYLLTAISVQLHSHHNIGGYGGSATKTAGQAKAATNEVGLQNFRRNVTTFFEVIDECFNVRHVEIRSGAPQLKTGFLIALSRMFSVYSDFWSDDGKHLFVAADQRRKLSKLPLQDPHIKHLAAAGGAARAILYEMVVSHMNSGRSTGQLQLRTSKGKAESK